MQGHAAAFRRQLHRCCLALSFAACVLAAAPSSADAAPASVASQIEPTEQLRSVPAAEAVRPSGAEAVNPTSPRRVDIFRMTMSAVAGLVLFIYGVTRLAEGLGDLNSERMRRLTARFTSNRFAGVATGFVATTLLESSSVTIIMVIAMVSGGVLTFVQSLGVVLGANIGTAIGAQIIAFEFSQYVPLLMLAGLLAMFMGRSPNITRMGVVLMGFGLMFYGLDAIDEAMKPLRAHAPFMEAMRSMGQTPVLGAAFGAVFTTLIQSSSATVAIVITLAGSGLISLEAGVALMLGAEIGTCSDTLVATIGRGRPALRTAVFHLAFNLVTACAGVALARPFVELVRWLSAGASVGRQIANAQMLFNALGVVLVLPLVPMLARALERAIPNKAVAAQPARGALPAQ